MGILKRLFIIFILSLIFIKPSHAGTYYVTGSGGGTTWANCTNIDTPCTLATANSNAIAGDIVYLRDATGNYEIGTSANGIAPSHSGTSGNPITFAAYPGETPVIHGRDYVSEADRGGSGSVGIYLKGSYTDGDYQGKNYIKVTGITFSNVFYGFQIYKGGHHEISYCTFTFRDVWADITKSGTAKNDADHYYQSQTTLYDTENDLSTYTNRRVYNVDGKSTMYKPASATTTTIVASSSPSSTEKLLGGTRQYWEYGDRYQITGNYPYQPAACDISKTSTHNYIHHNVIHGVGGFLVNQDGGVLFAIGQDSVDKNLNNHNTVEYNHIYHGGHHVFSINSGKYNVVRYNYIHNEAWFDDSAYSGDCAAKNKCGYRVVSCGVDEEEYGGTGLWENNAVAYGDAFGGTHLVTEGASGAGTKLATPNNIYRYNDHFGNATAGFWFGSSISTTSGGNRVYNNTFYHNGYREGEDPLLQDEYRSGLFFYASGYSGNVVKNNLLYDHWAQNNKDLGSLYWPAIVAGNSTNRWTANMANNIITNNYTDTTTDFFYSYSTIDEKGDPKFKDPTVTTPLGDDIWKTTGSNAYRLLKPDLSLTSSSPSGVNGVVDTGTYLTQANGAGSNSTLLVVDDARYFQDGTWGSELATGILSGYYADWIAVGSINNVAQISEIRETLTIGHTPGGDGWSVGQTLTGQTSGDQYTITAKVSDTVYKVSGELGRFTPREVISNGTVSVDQGEYTIEVITLYVAPATTWSVGDTITGLSSNTTSVITEVVSSTVYKIKNRTVRKNYTSGEVLTNGTYTVDQPENYPIVACEACYPQLAPTDIVLSSALTWNDNDPVYLYRKSDGNRVLYNSMPDMGAHEYESALTSFKRISGGRINGGIIK